MIDLCALGIGGMMPLPERALSAFLLRVDGDIILFDCGEGTQIEWKRSGWPFRPTGTILLSHVHADHVAGLPGILFQIAHAGREEPLTIYGPAGSHEIVGHLVSIVGRLPFELRLVELTGGEEVALGPALRLATLATHHRMPCLAYRLDLDRASRFDPERAQALGVPQRDWKRLQLGELVAGVTPEQVSGPPRRGLRVTLITDTVAFDDLATFAQASDLLICEAMYAEPESAERAEQRGHMTARQAGEIAARAGVRQLLLTHLSPSVADPAEAAAAAAGVYPAAQVATPLATLTLRFDDE